jgi:hypothetical protein
VSGLARVRVVVAASGLVFLGIGVLFLLHPTTVALVGLPVKSAKAASDVRAVFGGLELGLGVFLVWAAAWPAWIRAGLAAQVTTFGGLVTGRIMGLAFEGWPGLLSLGLFAAEAVGLGLGLLAAGVWLQQAAPAAPPARPDVESTGGGSAEGAA